MAFDLSAIPAALTSTYGLPLIASQVLCSSVIILAITVPVLVASHGRDPVIPSIFLALSLVLSYSIGWLDVWVMLILVILDAGLIALLAGKTMG